MNTSYLNNQVGYGEELLAVHSIIEKENYVLLGPNGLVKDSIPGCGNYDVTILGSPAMGTTFTDYLVTVKEGGKNSDTGGEGLETSIYALAGEVIAKNVDKEESLTEGGHIFSLESVEVSFENKSSKETRLYVYERRYEKTEGYSTFMVVGNANDIPWIEYEGMDNCYIRDFLSTAGNFGFDMNIHILEFKLGASYGCVETHIQEHGMYFLSGKGIYKTDNGWVSVKAGDYMLLDVHYSQACYAVGYGEDFTCIYSKGCNRNMQLQGIGEKWGTNVKLSYDELKGLMKDKLVQAGLKANYTDMTADVLTWSDERGYHSRRAVRVEYYSERIAKGGITVDPKFEQREAGLCSTVFEGDNGCGCMASVLAMERAVEMTEESDIAVVGVRNISYSGSIGYYMETAARVDLMATACCQPDPMAVPYGRVESYYGTNPISFATPTADGRTIILDMATTVQAWGEILDRHSRHKSIPDTWVMDTKGRPVTDSRLVSALVPIKSVEGYSLMMTVSIFSGVFLGIPSGKHVSSMYHDLLVGRELGQTFIVVDLSRFMGLGAFEASVPQVLDELGEMSAAKGFDRVHCPGGRTVMRRDKAYTMDGVEMVDEIYEYLRSGKVYLDKYSHKNRFAK